MVSRRFIEAVRLAPKRAYQIAHEAGLHPTTLSRIICGIDLVRPGDPRVIRIAIVLGLDPAQCFEQASSPHNTNAQGVAWPALISRIKLNGSWAGSPASGELLSSQLSKHGQAVKISHQRIPHLSGAQSSKRSPVFRTQKRSRLGGGAYE